MVKKTFLSQLGRHAAPPPIAWLVELTLSRPDLISLAAGFTDSQSLPIVEARALLDELLGSRSRGEKALQYGSSNGDARLRQLTTEELCKADGMPRGSYNPDNLIVTNGSQQLLYLTTEALCDRGDLVLVEDPTYFVFLGIMQSHGLGCRSIPLEADGLDLTHLERTLADLKRSGRIKRLKLLYLVSYFQNPTGITTSLQKKAKALQLLRHYEPAAGHPLYLLEDAAYRELRFRGEDIRSALSLPGSASRVVYAGTYSKPFATGARVGFGILPEPLLTAVSRIKSNHDFGTSNLLQQLIAGALASGRYAAHLPLLRSRYARKAAIMAKAMEQNFPSEITWREPAGGLYVWARLPRSWKSGVGSSLFKRVRL